MVHHSVEYEPGKPFSWFPQEVVNARREADKEPLKNNWVMLLEDLGRHRTTKHTGEERVVDKSLRSPLFHNLEEIDGAYEIKEFKRTVMTKRSYQCGVAVYQLASCEC